VFNLLRGWFEDGARVLDLFAGVGTMGLEAVSRGAAQVVMLERNREIFRLLERNIENLKCGDRATAVLGDALSPLALDRAPQPVDVVFIDPPYDLMEEPTTRARVLEQIARLREVMGQNGFVVLRSPIGRQDADFTVPGFAGPEEHMYGKDMHVMLYATSNDS
jgi:16S rRNA (guanine966-N2)-methyltransferase